MREREGKRRLKWSRSGTKCEERRKNENIVKRKKRHKREETEKIKK
jgi:hypothetical protein